MWNFLFSEAIIAIIWKVSFTYRKLVRSVLCNYYFCVEVLLHVVYNLQTFTFKLLQKIMVMMMMTMLSYLMKKQQMEMLMKQNRGKDGNRYPMIEYIHTYFIGSSPSTLYIGQVTISCKF